MRTSIVLLGLLPAAATLAAPVSSTFDADAESWGAIDFAGAGNYAVTYPAAPPEWQPDGPNDGYLRRLDVSEYSVFFSAPAAFLGNQSAAIDGSLSFNLRTTHESWTQDNVVVFIGNNGQIIVRPIAQPSVNTWQTIAFPLSAADFRYDNAQGGVVSSADFGAVMSDLEGLYLPAEFASGLIETTAIDDVLLTPEPTVGLLLLGALALRRR